MFSYTQTNCCFWLFFFLFFFFWERSCTSMKRSKELLAALPIYAITGFIFACPCWCLWPPEFSWLLVGVKPVKFSGFNKQQPQFLSWCLIKVKRTGRVFFLYGHNLSHILFCLGCIAHMWPMKVCARSYDRRQTLTMGSELTWQWAPHSSEALQTPLLSHFS